MSIVDKNVKRYFLLVRQNFRSFHALAMLIIEEIEESCEFKRKKEKINMKKEKRGNRGLQSLKWSSLIHVRNEKMLLFSCDHLG